MPTTSIDRALASGVSFLLALCVVPCTSGQQREHMNVTSTLGKRLDVITYSSPEFGAELAKSLRRTQDTFLGPMLPYCLFVRNSSTEAVAALVVRYDFTNVSGRAAHFSFLLGNIRGAHSELNFMPSSVTLVTPVPGVRELIMMYGSSENWPAASWGAAQDSLTEFLTFKDVSASIDSAVLTTGQIMGPDLTGMMDRINTELDAEEDLVRQLQETARSKPSRSFQAEVRQISTAEVTAELDPTRNDGGLKHIYARAQKTLAMRLVNLLDVRGDIAFKAELENMNRVRPNRLYR